METKKPMIQSEWEQMPLGLRLVSWPPPGVQRTAEEVTCRSLPEKRFATESDYNEHVDATLRAWTLKVRGA